MRKTDVAPSLQCADPLRLERTVRQMERAGAHTLHIDIMDFNAVDNLALSFDAIAALRRETVLSLDVHLMTLRAKEAADRALQCGADEITWHIEGNAPNDNLIDTIHSAGKKAGLALSPKTDVQLLIPFLPRLDQVLLMAVEPGFAGQSFQPSVLAKIEQVASLRAHMNAHFIISVDGGIDEKNGIQCVRMGADRVVAGAKCVFLPNQDEEVLMRGMIETIALAAEAGEIG